MPRVDVDHGARDVAGPLRTEEHDGRGHLVGLQPRHRLHMERCHGCGHVVPGGRRQVGAHEPVELVVVHHVRRHVARGDDVGRHPDVRHLVCHGLGEADDPPLRRAVRRDHRVGRPPHHRGDRDDPSPPPAAEVRGHGPHGVEDPGQVDIDGLRPPRLVQVEDGAERGHAGIGHQDVDRAQLVHHTVHEGGHGAEVAHVGGGGHTAPALGFDQAHRLLQVGRGGQRIRHRGQIGTPVEDGDVGTLARQLHGVAPSLSPGTTRDHGHPTGELTGDRPLRPCILRHGASPVIGTGRDRWNRTGPRPTRPGSPARDPRSSGSPVPRSGAPGGSAGPRPGSRRAAQDRASPGAATRRAATGRPADDAGPRPTG